jgi:KUP system potassium uptake protein
VSALNPPKGIQQQTLTRNSNSPSAMPSIPQITHIRQKRREIAKRDPNARLGFGCALLFTLLLVAVFVVVDSAFFLANISKVLHGAWFPLVIGGVIFFLMVIWRRGRKIARDQIRDLTMNFKSFQEMIAEDPPQKVKGQAVFMTGNPDLVPVALLHNLKHNRILHSEVALLHFDTSSELPRVPNDQKVEVEKLGGGFYRVTAHYGFMEKPLVSNLISLAREKGMDFDLEKTAFFLGRINLMPGEEPKMPRWQGRIFAFLSRNELDAASYFDIPSSQVIDLGVPLRL